MRLMSFVFVPSFMGKNRIGRKPVYFFTVGLQMVFGVSGLFAPEFYSFMAMTFLRALAFPAVWQAVFVLCENPIQLN